MTDPIDLGALDLAALLCSRVCHDIISPVGAIVNGLEMLDEQKDEETRAFAFDLIRKSANQASAKLQFARLAFGAAGSAGAEIDLGDAEKVATGYMKGEKPSLSFTAPRAYMAKDRVKLLLNLILLAQAAIPAGGSIAVVVDGDVAAPRFALRSTGPRPRVPAAFEKLVPGEADPASIDAHAVQGYYTGALARAARMTVSARLDGDSVVIEAATRNASASIAAA